MRAAEDDSDDWRTIILATSVGFIALIFFLAMGGIYAVIGPWLLFIVTQLVRQKWVRAACTAIAKRGLRADLLIVQSPETFMRTRTGIEHPTLALWTGKIKVRGWDRLGVFEKLFPIKCLDFAPAPVKVSNVRTIMEAELPAQANAA